MAERVKVSGRKRRRFASLDEVLSEARTLAEVPTKQLGNWSLGQICKHLGVAMEQSTCGQHPFKVPLLLRFKARLARRMLLERGLPSGFELPPDGAKVLVPKPTSVDEGLVALQKGIERLGQTTNRVPHPVFGAMNVAQWDLFHLRHSEMHLSFIVPE